MLRGNMRILNCRWKTFLLAAKAAATVSEFTSVPCTPLPTGQAFGPRSCSGSRHKKHWACKPPGPQWPVAHVLFLPHLFRLLTANAILENGPNKKSHEGPCISAYPARTYRNKRPRENCLPTSAHVRERKIHPSHNGTDRKTCNDKRNLLTIQTTSTNNHTLPKINYTNSHVLQK